MRMWSQFGDGICRKEASEHSCCECFYAHDPGSRSLRNGVRKALIILVFRFHGELGAVGEGAGYFVEGGPHLGEDKIKAGSGSNENFYDRNIAGRTSGYYTHVPFGFL